MGHQRPDTDSAVSAAVYADLLNALSAEEIFEGIVLGGLSGQTKWLSAEAGTPLPRQVEHLHPCVRPCKSAGRVTTSNDYFKSA